MIKKLSIKNFQSFKEEIILDLQLTKKRKTPGINVLESGNDQYAKIAGIFGVNASGKSSIIKAMIVAIETARSHFVIRQLVPLINPQMISDHGYIKGEAKKIISSFMNNNESNTEIKVCLCIEDVDYNIHFYFNEDEHGLDIYEFDELKYSRKIEHVEYIFSPPENNIWMHEFKKKLNNTLFFIDGTHVNSALNVNPSVIMDEEKCTEDYFNKFTLMVKTFDNSIVVEKQQQQIGKKVIISFKNKAGKSINLTSLSDGTRNAIYFFPYMYLAQINGAVLIFDEIENSLNKKIVRTILNVMNTESNEAQLIFTSHYPEIVDGCVRHDAVFIISSVDKQIIKMTTLRNDKKFHKYFDDDVHTSPKASYIFDLINEYE